MGRIDTSCIQPPEGVVEGMHLTTTGSGGYQIQDRDTLTLDAVIETKDYGWITVREYSSGNYGKLRCQSFNRDSDSWNGYLNRHKDGAVFFFDNGMRTKFVLDAAAAFDGIPTPVDVHKAFEGIEVTPPHTTGGQSILDQLKGLSATNRLDEMESNLKNDFFVFEDTALAGMMTLFYARPNTGKTLLFMRFLIDAICSGQVKGEDVFYINADDNYKGLLTKARIASEYGFHMISPQEAGVSPHGILSILTNLAKSGEANGKVVILDTLKKFTDMMSKAAQAALYEILRGIVTKGATVIIAGHANKHADLDGNLVYEGTSDTMNDIDCAYSMYRMSERDAVTQVVEFRREKDRGDIIAKVSYQYTKRTGMQYREIIDSVIRLDDQQANRATRESIEKELQEKYESEILFVKDQLSDGPKNQTEILEARTKSKDALAGEVSFRSLRAALGQLTDIAWSIKRDAKNAKVYSLIGFGSNQYRRTSDGE